MKNIKIFLGKIAYCDVCSKGKFNTVTIVSDDKVIHICSSCVAFLKNIVLGQDTKAPEGVEIVGKE